MTTKKIMVIGCGGVGSRHLQALCKIDIPVNLFAVDPSEKSLSSAQKLVGDIAPDYVQSIKFSKEFPLDVDEIDLCIISTSSDVRLSVLKKLFSNFSVKYLILEKVLFQSIEQLDEARKIINEKNIKSWVNCPRREEIFWKEIKKYFAGNSNMKLYYGKSDWSLCCNSIHFIDLAAWLFNDKLTHIKNSNLENIIYKSKRHGFIEFNGTLTGEFENGSTFTLESVKDIPYEKAEFEIVSDTTKLKVNEVKGLGILYRKENNWIPEQFDFTFLTRVKNLIILLKRF